MVVLVVNLPLDLDQQSWKCSSHMFQMPDKMILCDGAVVDMNCYEKVSTNQKKHIHDDSQSEIIKT